MPVRRRLRSSAHVDRASFVALQRSLRSCNAKVQRLERSHEIMLRRVATLQAEILNLRAKLRE